MKEIIDIFFEGFLGEPSIFLGFITMIGYIALRRNIAQIVAGAIKTIVGFRILQVGTGLLVQNFRPILAGFIEKFGVQGVFLDPEGGGLPAATSALQNSTMVGGVAVDGYTWIGYTLVFAFVLNIIFVALRKITKMNTVYVTGHLMFIHSVVATWIVHYTLGFGLWPTVIISGLFLALYWGYTGTLLLKPTNEITGGAGFSIGHQQMVGDLLAWKLGPIVGNPKKSIEEYADKLPASVKILQDKVVSSGIIMFIFIGSIMIFMGPEAISNMKGLPGKNWLTRLLLTTMAFPVALSLIMLGVKMFVAEIQQSFEGIRQKLLPGTSVAIDAAAIYGFAHPVTILFGFLFGALGSFIGVAVLILFSSPIFAIPGFIAMFFDNATIAVFANRYGGARAVVIFCTVSGFIQITVGAFMASFTGLANPMITDFQGWINNFDFETIWLAFTALLKGVAAIIGN